jgi:hypothetical protein
MVRHADLSDLGGVVVLGDPALRLKSNAIAAFLIIATVRGLLLNFGVYHATTAAIGMEGVDNNHHPVTRR